MDTGEFLRCRLLGGYFAFFIQMCLGVLCVGTLIVKRQTEIPRRDWFVWFLDALKQGLGSSFGHFSNIYLSVIIGTVLNVFFLSMLEKVSKTCQSCSCIRFGDYGNPPTLTAFFPQLLIWLCIVVVSKALVLLVLYQFSRPFDAIMTYLFQSIRAYPELELTFVMIIVPVIFNTMQFWIQDTFLKRQTSRHAHSPLMQSDLDEELVGKDPFVQLAGIGKSTHMDPYVHSYLRTGASGHVNSLSAGSSYQPTSISARGLSSSSSASSGASTPNISPSTSNSSRSPGKEQYRPVIHSSSNSWSRRISIWWDRTTSKMSIHSLLGHSSNSAAARARDSALAYEETASLGTVSQEDWAL